MVVALTGLTLVGRAECARCPGLVVEERQTCVAMRPSSAVLANTCGAHTAVSMSITQTLLSRHYHLRYGKVLLHRIHTIPVDELQADMSGHSKSLQVSTVEIPPSSLRSVPNIQHTEISNAIGKRCGLRSDTVDILRSSEQAIIRQSKPETIGGVVLSGREGVATITGVMEHHRLRL